MGKACGKTEPLLRLKIINQIMKGVNSDSLITVYFDIYSNILFNRIADSKELDYGRIYEGNQNYYGYIPLRSNFDNLIIDLATELIPKDYLSKNEKLICMLFSFDTEKYNKSIKKKEFSETEIVQLSKKQKAYYYDPFSYKLMLGGWMPINDPNSTFGLNPQLGVGFGFENNKFQFDISMDLRVNLNDDDLL